MELYFSPLWPQGPVYAPGAFPVCTDSVLLAHFAAAQRAQRCVDLGAGAGLISLLLCTAQPRLQAAAVELDPDSAALAQENFSRNALTDRTQVFCADLRQSSRLFAAGSFDLAVSNPPYYPEGSGADAGNTRTEHNCTLADVCAAAAYLLKNGGHFALVHRASRLCEALCAMSKAGLEPKRLQLVAARSGAAPSLFLVQGRRGGRPGLEILPTLLLDDEAQMRGIYHLN